jgi:hypothetical protein
MQVVTAQASFPFQDAFFVLGRWIQIPRAALALQVVYLKFYQQLARPGFSHIDPELYVDFAAFARRYHIEMPAAVFRPFWVGCGYDYYEQTPALYVLKLMLPAFAKSLQQVLGHWSLGRWNAGLYRFPAGYSRLFEAIAADIGDVRLNAPVTAVESFNHSGRTVVRVTANGVSEDYDRVMIATDLGAARHFLSLSAEEDELFGQIKRYPFNLYLTRASSMPFKPGSAVFFDKHASPDQRGHIVSIIGRQNSPDVWVAGQIAGAQLPTTALTELMREDLLAIGAREIQFEKVVSWDYFPHVTSQELAAGFYKRLEAMQGQRGLYYVGAIMNFETVEDTAYYAKELVRARF